MVRFLVFRLIIFISLDLNEQVRFIFMIYEQVRHICQ